MNDMSPAGAPGRLEISIARKTFRATSGGELHVLSGLKIALASGEVAALVGPARELNPGTFYRLAAGG